MALEPSQLELQIQNFSRLTKGKLPNIEQFAKAPGTLLSLSTQIKPLQTFEKRHEHQIETPTSGESSPCISDSEKDTRAQMPTMSEISDLLTEELSLDVDASIEKLRDFRGKSITLLFEDFDQGFRKGKFQTFLKDLRVNEMKCDRIVTERESRSICFKGTNSFLVTFEVRKIDLLYDFTRALHNRLKEETRRPIRVSLVADDRRKREEWHAVIIRNLPPKVTQKDILTQCQREVTGSIEVGTLIKFKERYCCIVRCDYLEDAEFICKRLNSSQLKDPQTYEKYLVKAYLHPQSNLRHYVTEKSLFKDILQKRERSGQDLRSSKSNKTGINELLDIFVKSKKPAPPSRQKPLELPKRKESVEEEKIAPPTNDMDSILKRICSTQSINQEDKPQEQGLESGELTQTSGLTKLMQNVSVEAAAAENGPPGKDSNGKHGENQDDDNRSDDKYQEPEEGNIMPPGAPPDDLLEKPDYSSKPGSAKKEFHSQRYGEREPDSGSRHVRRSSSKGSTYYRKPAFQRYDREDNSYHKRHNFHNNYINNYNKYNDRKKYEKDDRKKYHRDDRDKKRNRSSHRSSKSKSRSRSKSKSVTRGHKYKQYSHNTDNNYKRNHRRSDSKGSHRKSRSQNRRKHTTRESNSRSVSKSKSRSSRRERVRDTKDQKKPETTTFFEYNGKNSEDARSNSSTRKAKRERKSRSNSKDRNKKRSVDRNATKHYRNHSRERSGRPHQDYYNKHTSYQKREQRDRRDYHDLRNRNYHESSDRRNNYHQRHKRDYDDHRKKKDYDDGKNKHRGHNRSPSAGSKSVDKRSGSRSRSSESPLNKEGRRRIGSNEKNVRRSHSGEKAELRLESKLVVVAPETSNDHPKEKI